jgi:CMP/dCMP kinase
MNRSAFIIAIDGPAGAGKSTVSGMVARALGLARIDTGSMYRSVTLAALDRGLSAEPEVVRMMRGLKLVLDGEAGVSIDGVDCSERIRSQDVGAHVSGIAAMPEVRSQLVDLQRAMARAHERGAVLDGRDIGTVVFPDAALKIFLTATAEERARRRCQELSLKGVNVPLDEVLAGIQRRDRLDEERSVAPLRPADDAVILNSTKMSALEVTEDIIRRAKSLHPGIFQTRS